MSRPEQMAGTAWTTDTHQRHYPDTFNVGLGDWIVRQLRPETYLELGSGLGLLAEYIVSHSTPGVCCELVEPLVDVYPWLGSYRNCHLRKVDIFTDLSYGYLSARYDVVACIEVAEHVEKSNHPRLFDFLVERCGNWLIFSGARPGQGGVGHISERPESEWRRELEARGMELDYGMTMSVRMACDLKNINHRQNLLVFRRAQEECLFDAFEASLSVHARFLNHLVAIHGHQGTGSLFYEYPQLASLGVLQQCLRHKRRNLTRWAEKAEMALEIGFYAGHSALLLLLSNPRLQLTVVDPLEFPFSLDCFQYLAKAFPDRMSLKEGYSTDALNNLPPESYDLVHLDGGKDVTICEDLRLLKGLVKPDHLLVIDDYQNAGISREVNDAFAAARLEPFGFENPEPECGISWTHIAVRFPRQNDAQVAAALDRLDELYHDYQAPTIYRRAAKATDQSGYRRACGLLRAIRAVETFGLSGAFVEVGVAAGHSSVLAALTCSRFAPRSIQLFDTFAGFDASSYDPSDVDLHGRSISDYELGKYQLEGCSYQAVHGRMLSTGMDPGRLTMIQGLAEQKLVDYGNHIGCISVLRLDVDLYLPTKVALEVLYPKLQGGGALIVDDYGHWDGCRKAVDEFFADQNVDFLATAEALDYTCFLLAKPPSSSV